MPREALLARTLVELADTLVDRLRRRGAADPLADRYVELLEVGAAGLMLVAPEGDLQGDGILQRGHARVRTVRDPVTGGSLPGLLPQRLSR